VLTAIEGTLTGFGVERVDVAVGGVTFRVNVPQSAIERLGRLGDQVRLLTYLQVREDSLTLYGFPNEEARLAFEALVGVNGVGPKLALSVLSSLSPEALALAIGSGDSEAIRGVPGVGKKTANRIVLELSGKLDISLALTADGQGDGEVVKALTALGYAASEAMEALSTLPPDNSLSLEEKVRLCLQRMGSR
jgi:Holliday junction DNA helicase RuvA